MTKKQQTDRAQMKKAIQSKYDDYEFWKSISSDAESALSTCQSLASDDAHLDRLLVARNYDSEAALSLFWEQVEFRTKYKPESISPADLPVSLPSGAWRCCGFGKDGQVVSNYKLQFWNPEKYDNDVEKAMEEYTLYVCYFVELMIRCGKKNDRFSLIFDLKGFHYGMVTQEKVRLMIKRLIYVAQAQYPERLGKVYLVNAPCKSLPVCITTSLTLAFSALSWILYGVEPHSGSARC